jgi:glutathione S-transferase
MPGLSASLLAAVVTILAAILYIMTIGRVGAMRAKHKIEAPAISGHPEFERAYRVQMNMLESMPIFLPGLWLATAFFSSRVASVWWLPAAFGAVWLVGRYLYMQGYMAAPNKRGRGFGISALALIALLLLTIVGVVKAWLAAGAVVG